MNLQGLLKQAELLQKEGKFGDALKVYSKVDEFLNLNSLDKEEIFYIRLNQGHCARLAGEFGLGVKYYKMALRVADKIDERSKADALAGLGTVFRTLGKFKDALDSFGRAFKIYKKLNDIEGQAYIYWALGGTFRFMGYFKKSFQLFRKALSIYEELGDKTGVGYTLCGLGGVSRMMGNFELSLDFYTRANLVMREVKDRFGIAYSYCGIANANRMFGDFVLAEKYFNLATRNYEKIGDRVNYAYTLWGEGTLAKIKNDFEQAIEKFSKAEKIFTQTKDKRGLIYAELGKIEIDFILYGKVQNVGIKKLFQLSGKMGYNFERLHIMLVERLIKGEGVKDILLGYLKLGSKFFRRVDIKLPLNLP